MATERSVISSIADAASAYVGRAVADMEKQVRQDRELREAQFAARMAELETRIASVADIERRLAERLATLKDGEPGRDGVDGAPGRDGADGANGADGRDGQDGRSVTLDELAPVVAEAVAAAVSALPAPKDGRDGTDGRDGVDGKDGIDGERGPEGPVGKLPIVSEWSDRVHYDGEVVTRDGSVYQAIRDTGKEPGHEDWRCIVQAGQNGRDGRSFTIRGTWQDDGEYAALDVVALNGASFAARRDNPGQCPGEGWQIIATQGKQGKPGDRGAPGPKGDTGHVRALSNARLDDNGMLTLINADGSTVDVDFYPLLSKI